MILHTPAEDENAELRHTGMDCRHPRLARNASETSMSTWIQHSMLERRNRGILLELTEAPLPVFSKEDAETANAWIFR
jgi:hypothetical protein